METIVEFFSNVFGFLVDLVRWAFDGLLILIQAVVYMIMDGILTVIVIFVNSLDLASLLANFVGMWDTLPAQFVFLVNAVSFPQCLSIILYAYLIRMTLNLIPAALTRI